MSALRNVSGRIVRARNGIRDIPLPGFLCPIETRRQFVIAFLIFCGTALGISIYIELDRGLGPPLTLGQLSTHMFLGAIAGVSEELLFRGYAKLYLGNGGLVIGTAVWVVLHQFYAPVVTIYRLPSDTLLGIFLLKLWRGRLWWLALLMHPLWNIGATVGWQIARIFMA